MYMYMYTSIYQPSVYTVSLCMHHQCGRVYVSARSYYSILQVYTARYVMQYMLCLYKVNSCSVGFNSHTYTQTHAHYYPPISLLLTHLTTVLHASLTNSCLPFTPSLPNHTPSHIIPPLLTNAPLIPTLPHTISLPPHYLTSCTCIYHSLFPPSLLLTTPHTSPFLPHSLTPHSTHHPSSLTPHSTHHPSFLTPSHHTPHITFLPSLPHSMYHSLKSLTHRHS